jgi:hypothetical protein
MRPRSCTNLPPRKTEGAVLPQEGSDATPRGERGMPGVQRAHSLACKKTKSIRVSHHGHAGLPSIPRAMVLTDYSALSLVTGLVCHHHPCDAKHHHGLERQRRGVRTTRLRRPRVQRIRPDTKRRMIPSNLLCTEKRLSASCRSRCQFTNSPALGISSARGN